MDVGLLAALIMAGWFFTALVSVLAIVTVAHYLDRFQRADRRHARQQRPRFDERPVLAARPMLRLVHNDDAPTVGRRGA